VSARGAFRIAPCALALLGSGCASLPAATILAPPEHPGYEGYRSAKYDDPSSWLCRPDLPADQCRVDLTATEIRKDGSRTVAPFVPASAPKVDCFYVYPTVDLSPRPANHTDFSDVSPMGTTAAAQVGRFGEVCRMFAPL
jgi:hypothetical protein